MPTEPSAQAKAAEEAMRAAVQMREIEDEMYADPNAPECDCYPPIGGHPGGMCDFCMDVLWHVARAFDVYGRERERLALERAAMKMDYSAEVAERMRLQMATTEHQAIHSRRAQLYREAAAMIRALIVDGGIPGEK